MADSTRDGEKGTFVDQLRDIQGEYLMLSELYEKEKTYGHKLAETMRLLQYEVDVTIPINKDYLSDGTVQMKEAFLASEAVVVMVDQEGNTTSRPLDRFPPDIILAVIQDCTPELKRLISEKRRNATMKVTALEKVLKELRKAQTTFKQTKGQSDDEDDLADENEETEAAPRPDERVPIVAAPKQGARPRDGKEEAFAFRASFLEKKEAGDNGKA